MTRNHTEDMIVQFGGQLEVNGKEIRIQGGQEFIAQEITVQEIFQVLLLVGCWLNRTRFKIVLEM